MLGGTPWIYPDEFEASSTVVTNSRPAVLALLFDHVMFLGGNYYDGHGSTSTIDSVHQLP